LSWGENRKNAINPAAARDMKNPVPSRAVPYQFSSVHRSKGGSELLGTSLLVERMQATSFIWSRDTTS
jgi:hypothetical protein